MRLPSRQNPSVFHEENEQNGIVEGRAKNCKTVSATAGFLGIYVGREKRIQYRAVQHLGHRATRQNLLALPPTLPRGPKVVPRPSYHPACSRYSDDFGQTMPQTDTQPHCLLESWDTSRKVWVADPAEHESIASATAAASERGVYRIVLVNGDRRLELDAFAIV
jgi:hypothetical protein